MTITSGCHGPHLRELQNPITNLWCGPTTDEGLPQPPERLRPAGSQRASRRDPWWARYFAPLHSRLFLRVAQLSTESVASQSKASSRVFKISSSRREKLISSS